METRSTAPADGPGDVRRLFLGNLPKAKTEEEICKELRRITPALVRVITYKNFEDPSLHRGFCFLDYETAAAAAAAKQLLTRYSVFGCKTIVDWADPEPEIAEEEMATIRILFVRQYGGILDEAKLAMVFGQYGLVERVKNLKNYAFVHFERREDAQKAMDHLDGAVDEDTGIRLTVSWAKPPADKQIRERVLRDRERRMKQTSAGGRYRLAAAAPATAATLTVYDPASTVTRPYSKYDHYEYDFGWSMAKSGAVCSCQQLDAVEPRRSCVATAAAAVAAEEQATSSVGDRDDVDDARPRQRYRPRLRPRDGLSTDAGGGDCVQGTSTACSSATVDENVRKFFYKLTTGNTQLRK